MDVDFETPELPVVQKDPALCSKCQKNPAEEYHPCPYDCDIEDDDNDNCNCCDSCEEDCADDI